MRHGTVTRELRPLPVLCLLALVAPHAAGAASMTAATTPQAYCAKVGTDDHLHTPPPSLANAIQRLFQISGTYALDATQFRCAGGKVMLCYEGANLPCGKANTRIDLPGVATWCRNHPTSDFIPMVVTGHDTVYAWRCVDGTAKPGDKIGKIDDRGFFADNWKQAN